MPNSISIFKLLYVFLIVGVVYCFLFLIFLFSLLKGTYQKNFPPPPTYKRKTRPER